MKVAVIAHSGKSFGGGLPELRAVLERRGIEPLWREVSKSRKAPKQARRAIKWGADLIFVWGGDGMAQRMVDAVSGSDIPLALLPAGTANLLASSLGIPDNVEAAVEVGLSGHRKRLDIGRVNGEAFAVMVGAGFDAEMIAGADGALKDSLGRLSYVWTGFRNLRVKPFPAKIDVNGRRWFAGRARCVLVGNVSRLFGGIELFDGARPDDGMLEVGVVSADGTLQFVRALSRVAVGSPDRSPFVRTTKARSVTVTMGKKVRYEIDGGDREKVKQLRVDVEPGAIEICVPGGYS